MLGHCAEPNPVSRRRSAAAPGAGLADVDELAASTTAAGWTSACAGGTTRTLPPEVDLSRTASSRSHWPMWYATRTPAPARCPSTTRTRKSRSKSPTPGEAERRHRTGYGLVGMRERVALLHGFFIAAHAPTWLPVTAGCRAGTAGPDDHTRRARRRPRTGTRRAADVITDTADVEIVGEAAPAPRLSSSRGSPPGRRRHGHPHAWHGRHRGHQADHHGPATPAWSS